MSIKSDYKQLIISIILPIIFTFSFSTCFGQFFDESQSPLSVKWRQIEYQGFRIIFPSPIEKNAQKLTNTVSQIYPRIGSDLKLQKTHLPILLQNQGTSSNGFVQLAPKKSQLYTIYPQEFDSQDWLNNLAVHELRHAAQFDKITGSSGFLFPQYLYFAYIGLSTPIWFLEGDAVHTETKLTAVGRGRQANWIMPFRTQLLEGKKPTYSEAYFGSEKNQNIGYYQLGYLMTAKLHRDFGDSISNQILSDINRRPFRLYPFSQSLKKFTGHNTKQFYKQLLVQLKADWTRQFELSGATNYPPLTASSKIATDYFLPQQVNDKHFVVLKQSKQKPTATFVLIDSNKQEKQLINIGLQEEPWFNYANNRIVWDEMRSDIRYKQRSYNVICTYNISTKTKHQLTHKTRLFAPRLSADGKQIIAVEIDYSNRAQLVILDSENGKKIDSIPNPTNDAIQYPAFDKSGKRYTWISVNEAGKSLWIGNKQQQRKLISDIRQQLNRPIFWNNKIIFNAHYNGIDNIYSVDTLNGQFHALTSAKYGAFNGSISQGNTLLFNNYELNGYNVSKCNLTPLPVGDNHFVPYTTATKPQDDVFSAIPNRAFPSKPYRAFVHSFNFHSLVPTTNNNFDKIGVQLQSDDLLNTTAAFAGINYIRSLKNIEFEAGLSYKALFPIFSFHYVNRPRLAYYRQGNQMRKAAWREDFIGFNVSQPLSFNSFQHNYSFLAEAGSYYINRHLDVADATRITNTIHFPMRYRFRFTHQIQLAERDIAPRWGQSIELNYQHAPFENKINGKLVAINSYFYFPGITQNHSFLASLNFQKQSGQFRLLNEIETVYGYEQITALNPLENTLLFNYRFPLMYPDLEIGSLAYIRSVKGGLFCHYENLGSNRVSNQPKTFGFELSSDINLLRYSPIANLGGRFIFVNQNYKQNPIFELLFNYFF